MINNFSLNRQTCVSIICSSLFFHLLAVLIFLYLSMTLLSYWGEIAHPYIHLTIHICMYCIIVTKKILFKHQTIEPNEIKGVKTCGWLNEFTSETAVIRTKRVKGRNERCSRTVFLFYSSHLQQLQNYLCDIPKWKWNGC